MNVLRLGDQRQLALYGWTEHSYPFSVTVRGFTSRGDVHVEAVERSDDPLVENEWIVPFSWIREAA